MKLVGSMRDHEHLFCSDCGRGVLGLYQRNNDIVTCNQCGKQYDLANLKYDDLGVNTVTGWRFPMVCRDKED